MRKMVRIKKIGEQDKIHKITKESLQNNRKVEQNLENKIEIEAIEDESVEIIQDLPNQPDPSADHSSYDDKTGLESVNNSTYVDKSSIESVETVSDDDESRLKTIRAETNEFMNEISTREKYVTKILEIECENPERDKKIIKKQDKIKNKENDKEKQEIFTTKELANNKKDKKVINSKIIAEKNDSLNKISTTGKSLKVVGENPERDKKTIREQNKIRDKITKESPLDKNSAEQKFE